MPWLEFAGDLEKPVRQCVTSSFCFRMFLRCVVDMMRCSLINTPLNPSRLTRLPIRGVHHPILVETWCQQGLVANALHTRGHEHLRSVSCHLAILGLLSILVWQSWPPARSAADRVAFRIALVVPPPLARFWGPTLWGMYPHQAAIALRLLCLTVAFPEGHNGCECCCHI
jgi:hypothetical protein